jgi:hypothetical protein
VKDLVVHLPDDVYERAERRAGERGATLSSEVADFVKIYGEGAAAPSASNGAAGPGQALGGLFAALDAGRNDVTVGVLTRNELYDRPILH